MALTRVLLVGTAMSALMVCATSFAQQPGSQRFQNPMQQNSKQQGEQQGQLSPREVRSYFRQVEGQISQAVQSGNAKQVGDWTQANFANGASFQAVLQIGRQNGPGTAPHEIRVLSLDKNEMLQRQHIAFALAPEFLHRIQNYDLGIRVVSVQPIGNDAAMVKTRISESGTIGIGGGSQLGGTSRSGTQGMGFSEPQNQSENQGFQPGQSGASRFQAQRELQNEAQQNEEQAQNQSGQPGQSGVFQGQGISFNANAECNQVVQRGSISGHLMIGLANCTADVQF